MMNRQNQKGGDSSTNIQAEQMILHVGIDEKRAREIYQEMNLQLRRDYTQEALSVANARVAEFEEKLMPKMAEVEGALQAFSDPAFQLLLVEAQKTAASTERQEDYDLLSELLVHRFKKGENRIARAGISLAVGIVDKISDEALLGLTVAHAISHFTPTSGDIHQGLDDLNALFESLIYGNLPNGPDWLDHLDILNAVRLSTIGSLKKIQDYYPERLSGYVGTGIEKESQNHTKAVEILRENGIPLEILVDHTLSDRHVRLAVASRAMISRILIHTAITVHGRTLSIPVNLSEKQEQALNYIYDLYSQDENQKKINNNLIMEEWKKRKSLKIIKDWWNSIPLAFNITSAGKVLAHSNAQRCNKALPPLD
ncbi:LPO_1073/Vpar_1526 family protein [Bordetella hinzii]|uniref:LPO_1073/Vpar_1526 family protein n=1 Tax=Bordetella hinzii TaxID=103855 RepID=UPI003F1D11DE